MLTNIDVRLRYTIEEGGWQSVESFLCYRNCFSFLDARGEYHIGVSIGRGKLKKKKKSTRRRLLICVGKLHAENKGFLRVA